MKGVEERRRKDGTVGFTARPIVAGQRIAAKTFDTWDEAYEYKRQVEGSGPPSKITCDQFAETWLQDHPIVKSGPTRGKRRSPKTERVYEGELEKFKAWFRGVPLPEASRLEARRFAVAHPRAAVVARNLMNDAVDDGLVQANVFQNLNLEERRGRKDHEVLSRDEVHSLAAEAHVALGTKYGPAFESYVIFTAYVGTRLMEGINLEWGDVNFTAQEVTIRNTKFDKTRTVYLPRQAADALQRLPRHVNHPRVFTGKRGNPLTKGNHQSLWTAVRASWWATLPEHRRQKIVDLDWHSLRHSAGHWFYVERGHSDEDAAFQLGHEDAKLIRTLYGHGKQGALDRLKGGRAPTPLPRADFGAQAQSGGAA